MMELTQARGVIVAGHAGLGHVVSPLPVAIALGSYTAAAPGIRTGSEGSTAVHVSPSADRRGQNLIWIRRDAARETETGMLTDMADTRAFENAIPAGFQDDPGAVASLRLSHRIAPGGEAVVDICGELDIATAGVAVRYVSHVIDRHRGPVIADLAALAFCDASGLGALVRMAVHAEQAGCSFRLASPSPSLVKIMRITGLYCRFLTVRLAEIGTLRDASLPGIPDVCGTWEEPR